MTNSTFLYVPMQLDAWMVTRKSIIHKDNTFKRGQFDFTPLHKFKVPEHLFKEPKDFHTTDEGIYIHWNIPTGLRNGTEGATKGMVFPALPNRWLVVRYFGSNQQRQAKAWVVESDYLTTGWQENIDASTYPNWQNLAEEAFLGRVVELEKWQEEEKVDDRIKEPLTAVNTGEITFTQYQPHNQNVFSLHDKLENIKETPTQLSYLVVGWYSKKDKDLLQGCDDVEEFEKTPT